MENFIVSARKYRPATFDMVVGQDTITNTLKSAIKNNHLAQAYLFCGPRGVGKTTCARIFAKTINCIDLGDNIEACDKCESCLSFNSMRSFNIHELDAASNNKVEDIRSLNDQVRIPPQIGKYSIYIIDEVHMLSSSAFNAFLKTLEEPPSHAIFILATTEKHKIIPTILSRCQIFDFNRIRIEDIVARLNFVAKNEGITAAEEALHVIAQKADGAMRDALSIFDQIVSLSGKNISYKDVIDNLNVLDYEYYFKCTDAAINGDVSSMLLTFNEILEKGFDGHNFISGLNSHLRDLLVSKDEATLRLLEATPAVKKRYVQQTAVSPVDFLFRALEIGNTCDLNYKSSKNPRLHIELALIRLCRILYGNDAQPEKKKPDANSIEKTEGEIPLPSRSESIAKVDNTAGRQPVTVDAGIHRHDPVIEKPAKSLSIKDLMAGEKLPGIKATGNSDINEPAAASVIKEEFTPEAFNKAWIDFTDLLKGDGARIVSMFNSMRTDVDEGPVVKVHLNNAAQKDIFILNYKPRLLSFLEHRFNVTSLEIETLVEQTDESGLPYSDEQKLNYMVNKYPILKDVKKTFNLDIN